MAEALQEVGRPSLLQGKGSRAVGWQLLEGSQMCPMAGPQPNNLLCHAAEA